MDIRTLKLSDLNPAKYNPRKELKPGDTEFEKLKRSIESFGYVELIVVNEATGFTVISGHQRLSVLKALGYDSVECIVVSLDATREKALNIAMNKISGEWDTKKLSNLLSDLKSKELTAFITMLKKQPLAITEWNERLWITLLDTATVQRDGRIVFRFKSGKEITA